MISPSELAATIFLLLPGFLAVQVFLWQSYWRDLNQLELTLWSLLAAFSILVPLSALTSSFERSPSFPQVLATPADIGGVLGISLYLAAIAGGLFVGWLDRRGVFQWAFCFVGIDLKRQQDVWRRVLTGERPSPFAAKPPTPWIQLRMSDGVQLSGWPRVVSRDRTGSATEVLLASVQYRIDQTAAWRDFDGEVLLETSDVTSIWIMRSPA